MSVSLKVNGTVHRVAADLDTPLLYVLRNDLGLNGAKFGCGLGQCGACTVLIDGAASRSCIMPIGALTQSEIITLEGLGTLEQPHPLQSAFMAEQAAQCGYCIAGMIMMGKAILDRANVVAEMQRPHAGATATWQIVAVEPPRRFAYRWHPFAVDANVDYGNEPTTLVEFTLAEAADGVLLRIVESGFDAIPETRRADAFEANSGGWAKQTELVRKYLSLGQRV